MNEVLKRRKARLNGILSKLNSVGSSKEDGALIFKPEDMEFSYGASIKVETVEAKGKEKQKVFLNTTFMDDSINQNGWRLPPDEQKSVASQVAGNPLKIAHSKSDWDMLGTGIEGRVEGNKIKSRDEVTDPEAIAKFESGTWNEKNMGVSPRIRFESVSCSVCGDTISKAKQPLLTHPHKMNQVYAGQKCYFDIKGAKLIERSLTSEPAYRPSAGNIDVITLSASLGKFVNVKNMEEKNMSGENKNSLEAILIEKDNRIEELAAEVATSTKKTEELEASLTEAKKFEEFKEKHDKLEAELKETKEKLSTFVVAKREAELSNRLTDKDLIAKLSKQEITEEDFQAQLETFDKIKEETQATTTNADKGTIAAEIVGKDKLAEMEAAIGGEMFGDGWGVLAGEKKPEGTEAK